MISGFVISIKLWYGDEMYCPVYTRVQDIYITAFHTLVFCISCCAILTSSKGWHLHKEFSVPFRPCATFAVIGHKIPRVPMRFLREVFQNSGVLKKAKSGLKIAKQIPGWDGLGGGFLIKTPVWGSSSVIQILPPPKMRCWEPSWFDLLLLMQSFSVFSSGLETLHLHLMLIL